MIRPHLPDFAALRATGELDFCHVDVASLLRLSLQPGTEPWWGTTGRYRFDDAARVFGVTYAADTLAVAICETILHTAGDHRGGQWWLDRSAVARRSIVHYVHPGKTRLRLVDLSGMALKRLGLNNDVSASDDYAPTQQLSSAIHAQVPEADGIRYVSKQLNTQLAVALFERSGVQAAPGAAMPLLDHPETAALLPRLRVQLFTL